MKDEVCSSPVTEIAALGTKKHIISLRQVVQEGLFIHGLLKHEFSIDTKKLKCTLIL